MNNLVFSLIVLVFIPVSCTSQSSIEINEKTDLEKIQSELVEHFRKIEILKNVHEMNSFEINTTESGFLVVAGKGIEVKDEKTTLYVNFRVLVIDGKLSMEAESCTGNNCEFCKFVKKGGCSCERGGSVSGGAAYCNHSITKGFAELSSAIGE
jgi:hypothetical protein